MIARTDRPHAGTRSQLVPTRWLPQSNGAFFVRLGNSGCGWLDAGPRLMPAGGAAVPRVVASSSALPVEHPHGVFSALSVDAGNDVPLPTVRAMDLVTDLQGHVVGGEVA
jgi:hypothetical protein